MLGTVTSVMLVTLVACGGDDGGDVPSGDQPAETAPVSESAPVGTDAVSETTPVPDSTEGAGTLGDYAVEITGARLSQDYEGNPAIVVSYTWTNNSEDTTSAMVTMMESAFQDGVELENAIIMDDDNYDSGSSMKDVRPGASVEIQKAFLLDSESSVVEFEIEEFLGFSGEKVSMNFDPATL